MQQWFGCTTECTLITGTFLLCGEGGLDFMCLCRFAALEAYANNENVFFCHLFRSHLAGLGPVADIRHNDLYYGY